jgi:hypothetical protein
LAANVDVEEQTFMYDQIAPLFLRAEKELEDEAHIATN